MARGDVLLRQWRVLRALESARRGLSMAELEALVGGARSLRTVYRDVEVLEEVGFPIVREDGRVRLLTDGRELGWSVPVGPTHVLALELVERLFDSIAGTWLAEPLSELRERLVALLPPSGRAYVDELRGTAAATLFAPVRHGDLQPVVDELRRGIELEQAVRITYAAPNEAERERVIEPYATWFASGRLYVVARCRAASGVRTFAVHRIRRAEVLDETFEPPADFDLDAFVSKGFGVFHGPEEEVELELDADVAYLARERRFHKTQTVTDLPGGRVRVSMFTAGLPEIAVWVTGFGGAARVVRPETLRREVARRHREGLRANGDDTI